jgi:hypothetical protein
VVGKEWNPQIVVNLPVTNVPGCVSRNAKTLGLQHLKLTDMGVGSRPPDRACVVQHRTGELLVEQYAVLNGKTPPPVKEGAKHARSLSRLSPYLVEVRRPGQTRIKGYSKVPCCVDPLYWLSEKLDWPGSLDASRTLSKEHRGAL